MYDHEYVIGSAAVCHFYRHARTAPNKCVFSACITGYSGSRAREIAILLRADIFPEEGTDASLNGSIDDGSRKYTIIFRRLMRDQSSHRFFIDPRE